MKSPISLRQYKLESPLNPGVQSRLNYLMTTNPPVPKNELDRWEFFYIVFDAYFRTIGPAAIDWSVYLSLLGNPENMRYHFSKEFYESLTYKRVLASLKRAHRIYPSVLSLNTYTGVSINELCCPDGTIRYLALGGMGFDYDWLTEKVSQKHHSVTMRVRKDGSTVGGVKVPLTKTVGECIHLLRHTEAPYPAPEIKRISDDFDGDPIPEGPQRRILPVGDRDGDFVMLGNDYRWSLYEQ